MVVMSTNYHTDKTIRAFKNIGSNGFKFGAQDWISDLIIFLPDGVDAQPIVDAFNEAMEAAKPKQVAA